MVHDVFLAFSLFTGISLCFLESNWIRLWARTLTLISFASLESLEKEARNEDCSESKEKEDIRDDAGLEEKGDSRISVVEWVVVQPILSLVNVLS